MRLAGTLAVMLLLALPACSVLPKRPPSPALHDLGHQEATPRAAPWRRVKVDQPGWLQDGAINYRLEFAAPTRLRRYALDQWVASPGDMLSVRLNSVSAPKGRFILHLNLLAFEQDFTAPGKAHAYLRARAEAERVGSGRVRTKLFVLKRPTPRNNAKGAVDGLAKLTSKLEKGLRAWLGRPSP